jgi:signal transduction histidine kinase
MEEMLKDRSGGIIPMLLNPILQQDEQMVNTYFEKEIAQDAIRVVFDIPKEDIHINGNAEQLSKTFMNILGNAVYAVVKQRKRNPYTPYQPEVSLRVTLEAQQVRLVFRDNGIGIEQAIIDKIFDPFFTTKTTSEAAGVGLYLCHEIVQNHGGTISVQSVKHEYTEFTINLPRIKN